MRGWWAILALFLTGFGCSAPASEVVPVSETVPVTKELEEKATEVKEIFNQKQTPTDRGFLNIAVKNWSQPNYPSEARSKGISGTVVLRVTVGRDGKVLNVNSESGDPTLRKAAESWAKEREIEPYYVNGEAVISSGRLAISFGKIS